MPTEVKDRLLHYLRLKGISQKDFTDSIGVSKTYVAAMRRSISADKVQRIRREYPDLDTDWLLYGEGRMFRREDADSRGYDADRIPLLPVDAFAGRLQDFSQGVVPSDCSMVDSPIRGAELAIRVSGDSMEPLIHDGSVLYIKRINEKAFIPWGNHMVIDSENGVLVKVVLPSDNPDCIEAKSLNPAYPPVEIPRNSIYGLYRVLGVTTKPKMP